MDAEIDEQIKMAAVSIGCPEDAVLFVLTGWPEFDVHRQVNIDGATLCWILHDHALHLYGPNAREQLREWGIEATTDIGKIVFGLVDHELVHATESDQLDDFENVFEFEDQFFEPRYTNRKPAYQWNLFSIFVVTTLAAIAVSGFTRFGPDGIFHALISSWFAVLGLSCIIVGITSRTSGWLFLVFLGIVFSTVGLFAFFVTFYL